MSGLQVELETVTPLYMGGAFQQPEFRIPSVKGLLRYWYRALDPKFKDRESTTFGSTSTSQSRVLMYLTGKPSRMRYEAYLRTPSRKPQETQTIKNVDPGVRYILFPFGMKPGRVAISAGQQFKVDHVLSSLVDEGTNTAQTARRALIASWWALSSIGGLGARSRRGMGSIRILNAVSDWPEAKQISLVNPGSDGTEWFNHFKKGLLTIRKWFGVPKPSSHITLSKGCYVLLLGPRSQADLGYDSWTHALNSFGLSLQEFRKNREPGDLLHFGIPFKLGRDVVRAEGPR
ncbi:MAG: type III-B CRISPR module RAMP protein Cmr1, partial [Candidatus Thorarchaeota archaeon]